MSSCCCSSSSSRLVNGLLLLFLLLLLYVACVKVAMRDAAVAAACSIDSSVGNFLFVCSLSPSTSFVFVHPRRLYSLKNKMLSRRQKQTLYRHKNCCWCKKRRSKLFSSSRTKERKREKWILLYPFFLVHRLVCVCFAVCSRVVSIRYLLPPPIW